MKRRIGRRAQATGAQVPSRSPHDRTTGLGRAGEREHRTRASEVSASPPTAPRAGSTCSAPSGSPAFLHERRPRAKRDQRSQLRRLSTRAVQPVAEARRRFSSPLGQGENSRSHQSRPTPAGDGLHHVVPPLHRVGGWILPLKAAGFLAEPLGRTRPVIDLPSACAQAALPCSEVRSSAISVRLEARSAGHPLRGTSPRMARRFVPPRLKRLLGALDRALEVGRSRQARQWQPRNRVCRVPDQGLPARAVLPTAVYKESRPEAECLAKRSLVRQPWVPSVRLKISTAIRLCDLAWVRSMRRLLETAFLASASRAWSGITVALSAFRRPIDRGKRGQAVGEFAGSSLPIERPAELGDVLLDGGQVKAHGLGHQAPRRDAMDHVEAPPQGKREGVHGAARRIPQKASPARFAPRSIAPLAAAVRAVAAYHGQRRADPPGQPQARARVPNGCRRASDVGLERMDEGRPCRPPQ